MLQTPSYVDPGSEEERDDAVIGVALRYSGLSLIAILAIAGGAWLYNYLNRSPAAEEVVTVTELPSVREQVTRELPRIPFRDATIESGISFIHQNGASGEKLLPETMGGGCAFFDYDLDGDPDLLLVNSSNWPWDPAAIQANSSALTLYQNDGHGKFVDVTADTGLAITAYGQGCAVGDYDNDGDPDLYMTAVATQATGQGSEAAGDGKGPNKLFRNDGGKFVDVTHAAGVAGDSQDWGTSSGWFDYDQDGDLDLWVCNYVIWSREFDIQQDFRLTGGDRAYGRPQVFSGTYPHLYRNAGQGVFEEVSKEAGLHVNNPVTGAAQGKSLGLAFCDVDADGWTDVIVANDTVQNFLFHNQRNGTFTEEGAISGIAFDSSGNARGAMGIDIACCRNDQCHAVAIGNFANEMTAFYVSPPGTIQFSDEAVANGLGPNTRLFLTFGVFFFDADLDGWLDLFHSNGHLEEDIAKVQASQTYEQAPQLFWNAGPDASTEFVPLTREQLGADFGKPMVGRGAAYADVDLDGDLDVLIAATGQSPRLLINEQTTGYHWVRIQLTGNGTTSNRDAVGSLLDAELTDGRRLRRRVDRTRSYLSQTELPVIIGMGSASLKSLTITWPDGKQLEVKGVFKNQDLAIVQE